MTQVIKHEKARYFDDLVVKIQEQIDEMHPEYFLYKIDYARLETDDGFAHAFMIFNLHGEP